MKTALKANHQPVGLDAGILIARICLVVLMLTHGYPKLMLLFSGGMEKFPSILGMGSSLSLLLAIFSEVVCSLLILVGFKTRWATVPIIITMLVAGFHFHYSDPFTVKENAILYLVGFLLLFFTGGGRFSVDAVANRR